MDTLKIFVLLALVAVIASLATGVVSMMRGGEFDEKHSDQFMIARVAFQAIALVLLMLALLAA